MYLKKENELSLKNIFAIVSYAPKDCASKINWGPQKNFR